MVSSVCEDRRHFLFQNLHKSKKVRIFATILKTDIVVGFISLTAGGLFDKEELKRWMLSVRVPTEDEVEAKACTINAIRKINNARNGKI